MSEPAALPVERRFAPRVDVSFPVTLQRPTGQLVTAEVANLSATGMLIRPAADLSLWSHLTATLPAAQARAVRIVRRDGDAYGCLFQTPLEAEELDAVLESEAALAGFERLRMAAEAPPPAPKRGMLHLLKRQPREGRIGA